LEGACTHGGVRVPAGWRARQAAPTHGRETERLSVQLRAALAAASPRDRSMWKRVQRARQAVASAFDARGPRARGFRDRR